MSIILEQAAVIARLRKKVHNQRKELKRLNRRHCVCWGVYGRALTNHRTYELRGLMHKVFGYEAVHQAEAEEAERVLNGSTPVEVFKTRSKR